MYFSIEYTFPCFLRSISVLTDFSSSYAKENNDGGESTYLFQRSSAIVKKTYVQNKSPVSSVGCRFAVYKTLSFVLHLENYGGLVMLLYPLKSN